MSGLAIVAIPSEQDYVWKISSEKVPHLTLLFLGDQDSNPHLGQMTDFLEHVANTSLTRFGLNVERRGELGDQNADVLFFSNHFIKRLEEVRSYLLTNPHISAAYNSTEQYPSWTPHLTLGYPKTPARPDDREYPGISWVNFDRIALWTSDYEGPEFLLKDNDTLGEVGMSDNVEDFLAHFGVKGMRWGVRRTREQIDGAPDVTLKTAPGRRIKTEGGKGRSSSDDAKKAAVHRQRAKKSTTDSLSNKELQELVTRMNLESQYYRLQRESQPAAVRFARDFLIGQGRQHVARVATSGLSDATRVVSRAIRKK